MPDKPAINRITKEDLDLLSAFPGLDVYQELAGKSAIYPGRGTPLGIIYCALKLNGEAGELAEHVGKAMRDDGLMESSQAELSPERRELIRKELGDNLWYIARLAAELDFRMSDIALGNLTKLYDRTERNKLQGSGDDR